MNNYMMQYPQGFQGSFPWIGMGAAFGAQAGAATANPMMFTRPMVYPQQPPQGPQMLGMGGQSPQFNASAADIFSELQQGPPPQAMGGMMMSPEQYQQMMQGGPQAPGAMQSPMPQMTPEQFQQMQQQPPQAMPSPMPQMSPEQFQEMGQGAPEKQELDPKQQAQGIAQSLFSRMTASPQISQALSSLPPERQQALQNLYQKYAGGAPK